MPTTEIGSYRLEEELGRGAHGVVYRARAASGEAVAIKVVHPMLASDPGFVEALRNEYAKVSALGSAAGLFRAHELLIDAVDGEPRVAIVSEVAQGRPLSDRVGRPWPVEEVVAVLRATLDTLGECHARGMVHTNLKPSNVWVREGRVRLSGPGLARAADQVPGVRQLGGDLDFTAPEAFQGRREASGDVYALGQIVWLLLAGRPACPPGSEPMKMAWHLTSGAPDVLEERADAPVWLGELVAAMVAVDPLQRPRDALKASEMMDAAAAREVYARPTWQPERATWSDLAPEREVEAPTGRTPTLEADRAQPPPAAASPWLGWAALGVVALLLAIAAAVALP